MNEKAMIYTMHGDNSSRSAKRWLQENNVPYEEHNIAKDGIDESTIRFMLTQSLDGADDIISKRSHKFKYELYETYDDLSLSQLIDYIVNNPTVLKRPIILYKEKMHVGFDQDGLTIFLSKEQRDRRIAELGL